MQMIAVVALALVAVVAAAPAEQPRIYPQIVESFFDQQPNGAYNFNFKSDDGIVKEEEGTIKEALDEDNKPHQVVVVRGSYTYIDSDGKSQTVTYYADESGYHVEGDIVPKPLAAVVPVRR